CKMLLLAVSRCSRHTCTSSDQFTVTGPDHPVTASLGGEAVLSCHLSPRMSAENMEVGWLRSQDSEVVHLYHDGQDQNREQMLEYRGRTELLRDDITNGRVFLRIYDIQPSDNGQYKCFFQSSVFYKDALLELQVAGLGSDPVISVEGHQDGGIRVVCQSSGWNSQPEAQWRDLQGKILPSASENIAQEANGLFQTKIAIVIAEESNQKVSCSVRNPRLDQERESAISLTELFFPRVNPWTVALGVILPLLAVLTALASYCFWRQRRAKGDVMRRGVVPTNSARSQHQLVVGVPRARGSDDQGVDLDLVALGSQSVSQQGTQDNELSIAV
uniref:Ig-like domain-containing protein n=1 Tax=Terrapene triunguis TaxID=2587831 RepID=A0A674JL27_9SAUR